MTEQKKNIVLLVPAREKEEEDSTGLKAMFLRPYGSFDNLEDSAIYNAIMQVIACPIDRYVQVVIDNNGLEIDEETTNVVRASADSKRTAFAEILVLGLNEKIGNDDALAIIDAAYAEIEKATKLVKRYGVGGLGGVPHAAAKAIITEKVAKVLKPTLAKPEVVGLISVVPMDECFVSIPDLEMRKSPFVIAKSDTEFSLHVNKIRDKKNKLHDVDAAKIDNLVTANLTEEPARHTMFGRVYPIDKLEKFMTAINTFNGVTTLDGQISISVVKTEDSNEDKVTLPDGRVIAAKLVNEENWHMRPIGSYEEDY